MAGEQFKITTPNPFAATGGKNARTAKISESLKQLKAKFRGALPPSRPKVALNAGPIKGDLMLERTGKRAAVLNLGRMKKALSKPIVGQQTQTAPKGPPQQQVVAVPPKDVIEQVKTSILELRDLAKAAQDDLKSARDARPPENRGARTGQKTAKAPEKQINLWAEKERTATASQNKASGEIEKCLKDVNAEIKKAAGDPQKLEQLTAQKRELVSMLVGVHYPLLMEDAKPLPKSQELTTAFQTAIDKWPGKKGADKLKEHAKNFEQLIEGFSSGAARARVDGDEFDLSDLEGYAAALGDKLGETRNVLILCGFSPEEAEAVLGPAIRILDDLANACAARKPMTTLVDALMRGDSDYQALQINFGADDALAKQFKLVDKDKKPTLAPFPFAATLRAFSAWPAGLLSDANSSDPEKRIGAANSLEVMGELLLDGETPPLLLGPEPEFDKAAAIFQIRWGDRAAERLVLERYKSQNPDWEPDPKQPEPQELTDARAKAIAGGRKALVMNQQLTTLNRQLEGLLETDRSVWRKPSTWNDRGLVLGEGSGGVVAKNKQLMAALAKRGGKDAGRDVALLLARIAELELQSRKMGVEFLGLFPNIAFAPSGVDASPKKLLEFNAFLQQRWDGEKDKAFAAISKLKDPVAQESARRAFMEKFLPSPATRSDVEDARLDGKPLAPGPEMRKFIDNLPPDWKTYVESLPPEIQARLGDGSLTLYPEHDPQQPFAHIGISEKDLEAIGLDGLQLEDLKKAVLTMGTQGLGSIEDVQDTVKAINVAVDKVLRSELGQEAIGNYANASPQAMGRRLLNDMLFDAVALDAQIRKTPLPEADYDIKPDDARVVRECKRKNEKAKKLIEDAVSGDAWGELTTESTDYAALETDIVALLGEHETAQKEIEAARDVLMGQKAPDKLGIDIDADNPRGLKSARLLLDALDAYESGDAKACDACLEQLRGFDLQRMRRPWTGKLAAKFGKGAKLDIDDLNQKGKLADLRAAAEAILRVRDSGPADLTRLRGEIEDKGLEMDQTLESRANQHPDVMNWVRQQTRAAVLSVWPRDARDLTVDKDGKLIEGFDPAESSFDPQKPGNREKILKQLTDWGLDIAAFAPEIDSVIFGNCGRTEMVTWRRETEFSKAGFDLLTAQPERSAPRGALDAIVGHREMNETMKRSLLSLLDTMQDGDKIDLKAGQRITLDSQKIPIDPTGTLGVRAKFGGSRLGQFEIELGSDGYKLSLRVGNEGRVGAELVAGQEWKLGGPFKAKAEGAIGAEGSHSRLNGVAMTFEKSDAGREALLELVNKMAEEPKITILDLQQGKDVGRTKQTQSKLGAKARGGAKLEAGWESKAKEGKQGLGIGAEITVGVGKSWKDTSVASLNEETLKGETETSFTITGSVGVYAKLMNAGNFGGAQGSLNDGAQTGSIDAFGKNPNTESPNYDLSNPTGNLDALNLGYELNGFAKMKWKVVLNQEGQIAKAENARECNVKTGPIAKMASVIDPALKKRIDDPKNDNDKKLARDIGHMMRQMDDNDVLSVTYGLTPEVLSQVNGLMLKAKALQREGSERLAARLLKEADSLLDDETSYVPTKITLINFKIDKSETLVVNAMFAQFGQFSENKFEDPKMVISVPKPA